MSCRCPCKETCSDYTFYTSVLTAISLNHWIFSRLLFLLPYCFDWLQQLQVYVKYVLTDICPYKNHDTSFEVIVNFFNEVFKLPVSGMDIVHTFENCNTHEMFTFEVFGCLMHTVYDVTKQIWKWSIIIIRPINQWAAPQILTRPLLLQCTKPVGIL